MPTDFHLEKYLTRIKYNGPLAPDLATLRALHAAHVNAIPFEALDPYLGRPVKLDLASVQAKLVDSARGGYCFEQNALFKAVLETIGFNIVPLAARVRWMSPPDSPLGGKTHMLLKVDLAEGPYLADVGFGACVLDAPLRLKTDIEQATAMGTYRLAEIDGRLWLDAKRNGGWRTMYVFDMQPQLPADYELGSWFTSTKPNIPLTTRLIVERVAPDRRFKLVDRVFTTEARDGEVTAERTLGSASELAEVLRDVFAITPPVRAEELFDKKSGPV